MFTFNGIRYRNTATGRFVARGTIVELSVAYMEQRIENNIGPLVNSLTERDISTLDFKNRMREEIKRAYLAQYELGIGGRDQMTPADYGRVGAMLKKQYGRNGYAV